MLALTEAGLPRQRAYELVQRTRCAPGARAGRCSSCWPRTPRSPAVVDADSLAELFDLDYHLKQST